MTTWKKGFSYLAAGGLFLAGLSGQAWATKDLELIKSCKSGCPGVRDNPTALQCLQELEKRAGGTETRRFQRSQCHGDFVVYQKNTGEMKDKSVGSTGDEAEAIESETSVMESEQQDLGGAGQVETEDADQFKSESDIRVEEGARSTTESKTESESREETPHGPSGEDDPTTAD